MKKQSNNHSIKIGDIVQLKSGGPLMTVSNIKPHAINGNDNIHCIWFCGYEKTSTYSFKASMLLVEDKNENY